MTDYLISGGSVLIEDGHKTAEKADQYDVSRRVRVELTFTVGEGQSSLAVLDHVAKTADLKVHEMLGRKRTAASDAALNSAVTAAAPAASTEKPKATRTTKPKEEPKPAEDLDLTGGAQAPQSTAADLDLTGAGEPDGGGVSGGGEASEDDLSFLDDAPAEETAKEISDTELNEHVQKKHRELGAGVKILALLDTYKPDGIGDRKMTLRDIAQPRRAAFLADLAKLTK